jgi:hypothetical protein
MKFASAKQKFETVSLFSRIQIDVYATDISGKLEFLACVPRTGNYLYMHDMHEVNTYGSGLVCLSAWFNSTAGRILIKFRTNVMPLMSNLKQYFSIPYNG